MAITKGVGPATANGDAGSTTLAITLNGVTAGRSLVVGVGWQGTAVSISSITCTSESNLTLAGSVSLNGGIKTQQAYLAEVSTGGNKTITITFNDTATYRYGYAVEIIGADVASFVDNDAKNDYGGVQSSNASVSITTNTDNAALFGSEYSGNASPTVGAGYTSAYTNSYFCGEYKLDAGASGAQSVSWTHGNASWVNCALSVKYDATVHYTMTGSGGFVLGGTAPVEFLPTRYTMTGSGGFRIGGTAPFEYYRLRTGSMTLPMPTMSGTFVRQPFGIMTLPMPVMYGTVMRPQVFSGNISMPLWGASGSFVSGGRYRANIRFPFFSFSGTYKNGNNYSASLDLPMFAKSGTFGTYRYSGLVTFFMPQMAGRFSGAVTQTYTGWPVNLKNFALTQYSGYAFNSMARFNGEYLAAGSGGLFALSGSDDNGTAIDGRVRLGLTELVPDHLARVEEAFVSYRSAGDLLFKVIIDHGYTYTYNLTATGNTGMATNRAKVGKGIKSNWWCLELQNVDGSDFDLQAIRIHPVALSRRIGSPPKSGSFVGRMRLPMFISTGQFS